VLVAAPVPKPIPKGRFTAGLLARLVVEKFVLGRPVHAHRRRVGVRGVPGCRGHRRGGPRRGLRAARPARGGDHRARLRGRARPRRREVLAGVRGRRRQGEQPFGGCGCSSGPTPPCSPSPGPARPRLPPSTSASIWTLTPSPDGRRLLISSDFFTVYQALAGIDGVDPLYCWAHIHRYFIRAGDAHHELAGWTAAWLARIGALYLGHRAYRAAEPGSAGAGIALAR
jgi:transposase